MVRQRGYEIEYQGVPALNKQEIKKLGIKDLKTYCIFGQDPKNDQHVEVFALGKDLHDRIKSSGLKNFPKISIEGPCRG